jgi:hypothetical protein
MHATRPANPIFFYFDYPNNIWWLQIIKLLII